MPNWVNNTIYISGNPEIIKQMREQLSAPYEAQHFDFITGEVKTEMVNKPFSLWNIIKPEDLEAYNDAPGKPQSGENHWYNWNVRNWGTKWDVSNLESYRDEQTVDSITYGFDTPWAPPLEAIEKLAEQYPSASIELTYEEEQGWGGTYEWTNGVGIETNSYQYKCWGCDAQYEEYPEDTEFDENGEHLCDKQNKQPEVDDLVKILEESNG